MTVDTPEQISETLTADAIAAILLAHHAELTGEVDALLDFLYGYRGPTTLAMALAAIASDLLFQHPDSLQGSSEDQLQRLVAHLRIG